MPMPPRNKERKRLIERLCGDPEKTLVNFHVSWGPKAHLLTAEERAAVINRALDSAEERKLRYIDMASFPESTHVVNVREWLAKLKVEATEQSAVGKVARFLDPDAYGPHADEHIKWCEGYGFRMDWDMPDWRDHQYFGRQFAQRRREAEKKARELIDLVLKAVDE